ncbi:hypothetical protein KP79_PYT02218 [Mizuhopecten yessoensis]|uniref:Uncharacterized protein n=1 Tax=Mizuhopecten yessoensis TaxID=6573 RepID=A0A210PXH1_MIZYE|nr:hypothetical protein KP79_PYT02218 [Mizuhopecten yessoensis]
MLGSTKKERQTIKKRFTCDLAARCQAELYHLYDRHCGSLIDPLHRAAHGVREAIVNCYQGVHCECRIKSIVCAGRKEITGYQTTSTYQVISSSAVERQLCQKF